VEKYSRARQATDDNIIRRKHFACWIAKAIDTLRICSSYCVSTATMVSFICALPLLLLIGPCLQLTMLVLDGNKLFTELLLATHVNDIIVGSS
jgi:hypothetical protein